MSAAGVALPGLSLKRMAGAAALAAAVAFPLASLSVCARSLTTWARPLDFEVAVAAVAAGAVAALLTRLAWRWARTNAAAAPGRMVVAGGPLFAVLAVGLAVAAPAASLWLTIVLWAALVAEEIVTLLFLVRSRPALVSPGPRPAAPANLHQELSAELGGAAFTQTQVRSSSEEGGETVTGYLRGAVAAGQRSLRLHVGFCPPLAQTPRVEADLVEGDGSLAIGQALPQGVRFDIRVRPDDGAEVASVLLRYEAYAPAQRRHGNPKR